MIGSEDKRIEGAENESKDQRIGRQRTSHACISPKKHTFQFHPSRHPSINFGQCTRESSKDKVELSLRDVTELRRTRGARTIDTSSRRSGSISTAPRQVRELPTPLHQGHIPKSGGHYIHLRASGIPLELHIRDLRTVDETLRTERLTGGKDRRDGRSRRSEDQPARALHLHEELHVHRIAGAISPPLTSDALDGITRDAAKAQKQ